MVLLLVVLLIRPPGINLSEKDIQVDLDRRSPGKSEHGTNATNQMPLRFSLVHLKGKPLAHQSDLSLEIKIKNQKTIAT